MKRIFEFFAKNHLFALLFTLMILIAGALSISKINRDAFPTVDLGEIFITTNYPGASAEDVELFITNKLEKSVKEIDGIKDLKSVSIEGYSMVHITLKLDQNLNDIKQTIREAINTVTDLPSEIKEQPKITEIKSSNFPILEIGLYGDTSYAELRTHAKQFKKRLEALPGISKIEAFGYQAKEIQIKAKQAKLKEYQITLHDIIQAIKERNKRSSMGTINTKTGIHTLVTDTQVKTPQEIGDVIVRSNFDGKTIYLKNVSMIEDGFEAPKLLSRINGKPAISFYISKSKNADIISTTKAIKALAKETQKILPDTIQIVHAFDFSKYLSNRLNVMRNNGLIGLFLVFIMLSIFLNFRIAIWVAMGIPVSVMGVIFALACLNESINVISAMALIIVIGIIVDDAIIVGENITSKYENGASPLTAATEGIHEVYKPVLTTILTTFLAFCPIFFMDGIMGKFIYVIPLVITIALVVSLFEVTIALPAHISSTLSKTHTQPSRFKIARKKMITTLNTKYQRHLLFCLNHYKKVIASFFVLFICTILYAKYFMFFELFPKSAANEFFIHIECPIGSTLEDTARQTQKVEALLQKIPKTEISAFITRIGLKGDNHQQSEQENLATIFVDLVTFGNRKKSVSDHVKALRTQTDQLSGFKSIRYNIESGGPPIGKPITIRVVGGEDNTRATLVSQIIRTLEKEPGVRDINRDDTIQTQQLKIKPQHHMLSKLGLTVSDLVYTIRTAVKGRIITNIRDKDEDVSFRLSLLNPDKIETLQTLDIPNKANRLVPIKTVATIEKTDGAPNYYHFDSERTTTITGEINKKVTTVRSITQLIKNQYSSLSQWPNIRLVLGGESKETDDAIQNLFKTFIISIIGIYFLLVLLFSSFLQPLLVLTAIPFGVMGVIIAFAIHQEHFGFLSIIGIIGLCGVVVNDSLVMVNHINNIKKRDPSRPIQGVIIEGAKNRFRPIILTSLTTIAGLLPLVYGIGGSDPFIAPLALAIGYGLLLSTPLTLFFLPCFYQLFHNIQIKIKPSKPHVLS